MTAINTLSTTFTPTTTTVSHLGPAVNSLSVSATPAFSSINQTPQVAYLIDQANALLEIYNTHIISSTVHVNPDSTNPVVALKANDLASAISLLNDLKLKYNLHRVQDTVHGNVVRILIEAPTDLKFNDIKFFTSSTGTPDLVSSFSDDETQSQIPTLTGP